MGAADWFVALSEPGPTSVYAFAQAGGGCATFAPLADRLAPEATVWAMNLPGRQARFLEPPRTRLDPLLDELADAAPGHHAPVYFGYCSGALLAFLLIHKLRARGRPQPAALVVASYPAPDQAAPPSDLHLLDSDRFWQEILSYGGVAPQLADQPDFREIFEVALRADYALLADYHYAGVPPLDIPIVALRGADDPMLTSEQIAGWGRHTNGPVHVRTVPGDHWLLDGALSTVVEQIRGAASAG